MLFTGVSTDSRSIRAGDLFVALRGERFDGHDFLKAAAAASAAAAMVDAAYRGECPLSALVVTGAAAGGAGGDATDGRGSDEGATWQHGGHGLSHGHGHGYGRHARPQRPPETPARALANLMGGFGRLGFYPGDSLAACVRARLLAALQSLNARDVADVVGAWADLAHR